MKILIVDDDIELTKAVTTALTSFDHDVQTTNEPRDGLTLIKERPKPVPPCFLVKLISA